MGLIGRLVVFTSFLTVAPVFGESNARHSRDLMHLAGGGVTYAASYAVARLLIQDPEHKWVCHVLSAFVTTAVAASWELQHVGKESVNRPSGRDFGYSMLGAGAVMGATVLFNF